MSHAPPASSTSSTAEDATPMSASRCSASVTSVVGTATTRVPPLLAALLTSTRHSPDPDSDSVVTIEPDTEIHDAAKMMFKRNFRHLPVVNSEGRLLGIASLRRLSQYEFEHGK